MVVRMLVIQVLILFFCIICGESIELFSSLFVGLGSALYAGWNIGKCKLSECCDRNWIVNDFSGLAADFEYKLHGQHLVSNIVLRSLRHHLKNGNPSKALVLSFHGRTGTGKNLVADLIASRIFKLGSKSEFFKLWIAKLHYPHESLTDKYKDIIQDSVRDKVKACPRAMFVFDEADYLAPGLIDTLKPFLDHYEELDGVDYRKSTFIFLSNTGSTSIANVAYRFWEKDRKREDLTMKEIEPLIKLQSFNEEGGLHKTALTKNSLIDFYVPFLPLEKKHIKMCIKDYLEKKGCQNMEKLIKDVADSMEYEPPDFYSKTGCKTIESKVHFFLEDECTN